MLPLSNYRLPHAMKLLGEVVLVTWRVLDRTTCMIVVWTLQYVALRFTYLENDILAEFNCEARQLHLLLSLIRRFWILSVSVQKLCSPVFLVGYTVLLFISFKICFSWGFADSQERRILALMPHRHFIWYIFSSLFVLFLPCYETLLSLSLRGW